MVAIAPLNADETEDLAAAEARGGGKHFSHLQPYDPSMDATDETRGGRNLDHASRTAFAHAYLRELENKGRNKSDREPGHSPTTANEEKDTAQPTALGRRILEFAGKHKRGIAIGTSLGGGSIVTVIIGFSALLPLKLDFIMSNIDRIFGSPTTVVMNKMSDRLLSNYFAKYVLPGVSNGLCKSTIEPTCVKPIGGKSLPSRLFSAWRQNSLETKLAKKGVVFGKRGNQLYMAVQGKDVLGNDDLLKIMNGDASLFDVASKINPADLEEARDAVRNAFKDASLWDRVYTRFKVGRLVERKYGVKRCIIACNSRDKFRASINDKKLAARAFFIRNVFGKTASETSLILQCVMTDADFCNQTLQKVKSQGPSSINDSVDTELSPFQQNLQQQLADYAATASEEDLAKLIEDIGKDYSKRSFTQIIVERALSSIFGESVGKTAGDLVPVIGWVLVAAQIIHSASKLGPTVRFMSYSINFAAAVNMYMMYQTADSEMKSGHMDATELGSLNSSLTTNMTGSSSDQADATSTPLYGALIGSGTDTSKYKCNDGSTVPQGQLVCPEEKLDRGNDVANQLSSIVNDVPLLAPLAGVINQVNNLVGYLVSGAFNVACHITDAIPPGGACTNAVNAAGQKVGEFSTWLVNKVVASPFSDNMSGGRTFDMIAAGADGASNKACQVELGCAQISDQQVADMRSEVLTEQKREFEQQPLFARLFSTSSTYSLVSQLAMTMPPTLNDLASKAADVLSNPLGYVAEAFSAFTPWNKVLAATTPINDPFGIVQYGYTSDQIPRDPELYWNQHCQGDFTTPWLNSQVQDPDTGEALATTPQPCLLIQTTIQSTGGMFDSSLIPSDEQNPGGQ